MIEPCTSANNGKTNGTMPFENLIVTCERGEDLSAKLGSNYFDYIYTDVPCTGDGTFRKHLRYGLNGILQMHLQCIVYKFKL